MSRKVNNPPGTTSSESSNEEAARLRYVIKLIRDHPSKITADNAAYCGRSIIEDGKISGRALHIDYDVEEVYTEDFHQRLILQDEDITVEESMRRDVEGYISQEMLPDFELPDIRSTRSVTPASEADMTRFAIDVFRLNQTKIVERNRFLMAEQERLRKLTIERRGICENLLKHWKTLVDDKFIRSHMGNERYQSSPYAFVTKLEEVIKTIAGKHGQKLLKKAFQHVDFNFRQMSTVSLKSYQDTFDTLSKLAGASYTISDEEKKDCLMAALVRANSSRAFPLHKVTELVNDEDVEFDEMITRLTKLQNEYLDAYGKAFTSVPKSSDSLKRSEGADARRTIESKAPKPTKTTAVQFTYGTPEYVERWKGAQCFGCHKEGHMRKDCERAREDAKKPSAAASVRHMSKSKKSKSVRTTEEASDDDGYTYAYDMKGKLIRFAKSTRCQRVNGSDDDEEERSRSTSRITVDKVRYAASTTADGLRTGNHITKGNSKENHIRMVRASDTQEESDCGDSHRDHTTGKDIPIRSSRLSRPVKRALIERNEGSQEYSDEEENTTDCGVVASVNSEDAEDVSSTMTTYQKVHSTTPQAEEPDFIGAIADTGAQVSVCDMKLFKYADKETAVMNPNRYIRPFGGGRGPKVVAIADIPPFLEGVHFVENTDTQLIGVIPTEKKGIEWRFSIRENSARMLDGTLIDHMHICNGRDPVINLLSLINPPAHAMGEMINDEAVDAMVAHFTPIRDDGTWEKEKQLLHERCGHKTARDIVHAIKHKFVRTTIPPAKLDELYKQDQYKIECYGCLSNQVTKQRPMHNFDGCSSRNTAAPGEIFHADDHQQRRSIHGNEYCIAFTDLATEKTVPFFFKKKRDWPEAVRAMLKWRHESAGKYPGWSKLRIIRYDKGSILINNIMKAICANEGISILSTGVDSQEQNGTAERPWNQLVRRAASAIQSAGLSATHWEPALIWSCNMHAIFTKYRRDHSMSIEQVARGREWMFDMRLARKYGSPVFLLKHKMHAMGNGQDNKFVSRSTRGIYIGPAEDSKAAKILLPGHKIVESIHFLAVEKVCSIPAKMREVFEDFIDEPEDEIYASQETDEIPTKITQSELDSLVINPQGFESGDLPEDHIDATSLQRSQRSTRDTKPIRYRVEIRSTIDKDGSRANLIVDDDSELAAYIGKGALYNNDIKKMPPHLKELFEKTRYEEVTQSLRDDLGFFRPIDLQSPPNGIPPILLGETVEQYMKRNKIPRMFTRFTVTRPNDVTKIKIKCREVFDGKHLTFKKEDVYSPTASTFTVFTLLQWCVEHQAVPFTTDIKNAYPQAPAPDKSLGYISRRESGWEEDMVFEMGCNMYGKGNASKIFNDYAREIYTNKMGGKQCPFDPNLYMFKTDLGIVISCVYSDDNANASTTVEAKTWYIESLAHHMTVGSVSEMTRYLGMDIKRVYDGNGIYHFEVCMDTYVKNIPQRLGMTKSTAFPKHPPKTPMTPAEEAEHLHDAKVSITELEKSTQQLLGVGRWLLKTMPALTRSLQPWNCLRFIQYVLNNKIPPLYFRKTMDGPPAQIITYVDARDQPASNYGIAIFANAESGPIYVEARKSGVDSFSSGDCEARAVAKAAKQTKLVKDIHEWLYGKPLGRQPLLLTDSEVVVKQVLNPIPTEASKYLITITNAVRSLIREGSFMINHISGKLNLSDGLTRVFARNNHIPWMHAFHGAKFHIQEAKDEERDEI